ncbi:MAG TPA: hypothetical protein VHZ07_07710 [Bryobacteraceae bacterium]|jgi:hypothetical protein|nr:hypothetical protein [Bryobacteraceae bacterium]
MRRQLWNKRPTTLLGSPVKQSLKWTLQTQLMTNLLAFKVLNVSQVRFYNRVAWAHIEHVLRASLAVNGEIGLGNLRVPPNQKKKS